MSNAPEQAAPRTRGLLVADLLAGSPERLPLEVALGLTAQVAQLIQRTHESGRLHQALSPGAVWCTTEGEVWLEWLPRYWPQHRSLPPEVRHGDAPTIESDVYALGALAYELLTGLSVSRAWAKAPLVHLSHVASPKYFNAAVPDEVDGLIIWALARDPYDRPHSAAEVSNIVEKFITPDEWPAKLAALLEDPFYEPALRALPITCERAGPVEPLPEPPPKPELYLATSPPKTVVPITQIDEEEEDELRRSPSLMKIMLVTSAAAVASLMLSLSAHVLSGDGGGIAIDAAQAADLVPRRAPAPRLLPPVVIVEAEPVVQTQPPAPSPKLQVKAERPRVTSRKLNHAKRRGR